MNLHLDGVFPPLLTPFTRDGRLDLPAHGFNCSFWNRYQLAGYLVLGSNGETPYLTYEEKLRLIESTVIHAAPGRVILAGTGAESTAETIRLTRDAATAGAMAVLVITPSYYHQRMTDEALISHFNRIADASPVPVLVYNVPAYTHISISVPALQSIAQHQNIAGMKESTPDAGRLKILRDSLPAGFTILTGSASVWYPALTMGIRGGIMALANIAPGECIGVFNYWSEGNASAAEDLYRRLLPLNAVITAKYSVSGLKTAAGMIGLRGCHPREPLLPLNPQEEQDVRNCVQEAGIRTPSVP